MNDTREMQDHPYLPHYDRSSAPGDDGRFELTPEKRAQNTQHAADKAAVEGGRTLRLVLAAPIILWSFVGIPALGLLALVTVLGVVSRASVDAAEIDAGTVGFFVLLALIEVASIWEGLLLMRDRLSASRWRAVLLLSVVVALAVSVSLALSSADTRGWLLAPLAAWYCVGMAFWQWRRSVRLAPAVERLQHYFP